MKYKVLVCDMDGSLFEATKLPIVSERCKDLIIKLQKKGYIVVLNTARIIQGSYPLAKTLELDKYGGYLICCNGSLVYDMAQEKAIFETTIDKKDAFAMWDYVVNKMHYDFAIAQPDYMVATNLTEGFVTDHEACFIDYLCTDYPKKRIEAPIWKCAITMSEKTMDENFVSIKETLENEFPYKFLRSAERYIDISRKYCDKVYALNQLFDKLGISWEEAVILGDGNSDADMIRLAGYGVTLENGTDLCKQYAKRVLPNILEDGCCVLFEELLED